MKIQCKVVNRCLIISPFPYHVSSFLRELPSFSLPEQIKYNDFDKVILDEYGEIRYFHIESILNFAKSLQKPVTHFSLCSNYSQFSNFQDVLPSVNSNDFMIYQFRTDLPEKKFFSILSEVKHKVLFLNGRFRFGRYYFDQKVKKYVDTSDWIYYSNNFISLKFLKRKSYTFENYVNNKVKEEYRSHFFASEQELNFHKDNQSTYTGRRDIVSWPYTDYYTNTFLELVTETFSENGLSDYLLDANAICVTEKTFKPILCGRPFIINSNPGFLKNLHSMGFKTFANWWDESYDSIFDIDERHNIILKNLNFINSLTKTQILEIYMEMLPILKHNFNLAAHFLKGKREVEKFVNL